MRIRTSSGKEGFQIPRVLNHMAKLLSFPTFVKGFRAFRVVLEDKVGNFILLDTFRFQI